MAQNSTFVVLDSRKRLNLASIATTASYLVTREPNGRIILDPAVVMTEQERAVLADPEVRAGVMRSREQHAEHRPRRRLTSQA